MNDAERRRQELLEQTRALYNDRRTIPAVHPRYANAYHYLYGKSQEDINEDTKAEHLEPPFFVCIDVCCIFNKWINKNRKYFI